MKKIVSLSILCLFLFSNQLVAQNKLKQLFEKNIPSTQLKDLDGKTINTSELYNDGKPIVISFWATWCTPCKEELNAIHELYDDWQDETGVRLIAVSVDDQRTANRVVPYVDSKSWEYQVLLDPNGDFKRAMGVNNIPHTFLVDGEGKIAFQHNNYSPGDEFNLYDEILKIAQE